MSGFRASFPDLNFWGTAPLLATGDHVIGQWEGGGTHAGPAFSDFLVGSLPAASGRKMHFTGITILRRKGGKIVEEVGLDDGVTALTQLGLLVKASKQGFRLPWLDEVGMLGCGPHLVFYPTSSI